MNCEIRLRAERKAGQLLQTMEKARGGRPSKTPATGAAVSTLADMGISEHQSRRWQDLRRLPALLKVHLPVWRSTTAAPARQLKTQTDSTTA